MHWWEIIIRLMLALIIGVIVGIQREFKQNSAGMRTHALVSVGACMAMLTNEYLFRTYCTHSTMDIARMGSYVLSGIGFLGAGTILKDGIRVRGLTTAAGLWVVACLGIAAGAGFYIGAGVATLLVMLIISVLKIVEKRFLHKKDSIEIALKLKQGPGQMARVLHVIGDTGAMIKDVSIDQSGEKWQEVVIVASPPRAANIEGLSDHLDALKGIKVHSIDIE